MVFFLPDDAYFFPDPHEGEENGLLAVGGNLSLELLTLAYLQGIFPWFGFKEEEDILWWCPMDRFVIFPREIHISHSMRQLINSGRYHATVNKAFGKVIENCSTHDRRDAMEGAWLGGRMIPAYKEMHMFGIAASVEVWDEDEDLIGGLYGVNIGNNFFGESMFSKKPDASKFALIHLAKQLESTEGIIDCQFETPHLKSMGGRHIPYDDYMTYLNKDKENRTSLRGVLTKDNNNNNNEN